MTQVILALILLILFGLGRLSAGQASTSTCVLGSGDFALLWQNSLLDASLPYRIVRQELNPTTPSEQEIRFKQLDKNWTLFVLSHNRNSGQVRLYSLQNYGLYQSRHQREVCQLIERLKTQRNSNQP